MDLRTQTSLIASVLSVAIASTVVLRPRRRHVHWLFAFFAVSVAAWYLTTFLARATGEAALWGRINLTCAVILPVAAVLFFRAFIAGQSRLATALARAGALGAATLWAIILSPLYAHPFVAPIIFSFVCVMLGAVIVLVFRRGRVAGSRVEQARLRYLALAGAFAATFTIVDYLPYVGLDIPPVGTVLTLIFLYALAQSIVRYRLLDLYELAGTLTVLTVVSFTLAGIFWVLVYFAGKWFFLHSVVAAMVVLLVFDPIRTKVEEQISQIFFRERHALEEAVSELRRRVANALSLSDLTRIMLAGLESSRRVTNVAIYLSDDDLRGYDLAGSLGQAPIHRIEAAPARALLDRLRKGEALVLESLEREVEERRELGEKRDADLATEIIHNLEAMQATVCVGIIGEHEIYGILAVRDDRLRDAYTPEEVELLRGLATQAATAAENSRVHLRVKERDRLAALGEMAAGLAHEIRNPLGAIKASAQFLAEPVPDGETANTAEFLGIIVAEVNRLNRVVSSFLDYARPSRGDASPTNVNDTIRRTMQLLGSECEAHGITWSIAAAEDLPLVRIDVEQLRQVLINLVQNAVQAMNTQGSLVIETLSRSGSPNRNNETAWVEIRVRDTGPGIPARVMANLFVPFVTTKDTGTGLGLAISQRIVSAAGGTIEVRTHENVGTTFVVRLPPSDQGPVTARHDAIPARESSPAPAKETGASDRPSSVTENR
ncbi:MAG: GAF domain-containing protein [Sandaracinaceae bacterium]|nr:GAF domain-containing protein [Sandaracinaceae bacterium]